MSKGVYKRTEKIRKKASERVKKYYANGGKCIPSYGMLGKHHTKEVKIKISEHSANRLKTEKLSYNWKGDNVGYRGIHTWITKKLGKPTKCEHCGKDGLIGKQIGWANIGHTYRRKVEDWIRLCRLCHCKFDKNIIL